MIFARWYEMTIKPSTDRSRPFADNVTENDAVSYLQSQHRAVEKLFTGITDAPAADKKAALFRKVADHLAIHAIVEERHFYPAVKESRTRDVLLESLEELLGIKRVLADMLDVSVTDPIFDAKLKTLKKQVSHHIREEEQNLFPQVRKIFSTADLFDIALNMRKERAALEGTEARLKVPSEIAEAASLP
jgi:hemerythrin superfamily protein